MQHLHHAKLGIGALLVCVLSACGGGNNASKADASGSDARAHAASLDSSASSASAPTIVVDMPETFTPSKNLGLVFVQGGAEQKIRFVDGAQEVVLKREPFQILFRSTGSGSIYMEASADRVHVPGAPIYIAGNVMAWDPSWENATNGFGLTVPGMFGGFNRFDDYELVRRDATYKALNIKVVQGGWKTWTSQSQLDLLIYVPRPTTNPNKPTTADYEVIKLKLKGAVPNSAV
jgi:hypothetical protein